MTQKQVVALLIANKNEKGILKWHRQKDQSKNLKSLGIGLTVLRKLAKQIGRDHDLAMQLWESDLYDAKIISLLIDDPKMITIAQAEMQVELLNHGHLAHVFSSCDASLAKTSFAADLASKWMENKDPVRRRCSYGLIYELSKSKKKSAPDHTYFIRCIQKIRETYKDENLLVLASMGGALLGIGKRSAPLNIEALKLAKTIGPIEIESESGRCDPFDVVKHLTSDYIKQKLGV